MALQTINLGTYANDGTGDDLRTAFEKVNANLSELFGAVGGANIGSVPPASGVAEGELWWSTVDGRLYVYYNGAWIDASPSSTASVYSISAENTAGGANIRLSSSDLTSDDIKIAGSENITVTRTDASTITLSSTTFTGNVIGTVSDISNHDLSDLGNVSAIAPIEGQALVYSGGFWTPGSVAASDINTFEFGGFNKLFTNPVSYLLDAVGVDFGTFSIPSDYTIDLGTF